MPIRLTKATEERIRQHLDRGGYETVSELLEQALDLLDAEEDWLLRNRQAIGTDLDESFAQDARGEGLSVDETRAILARRRRS